MTDIDFAEMASVIAQLVGVFAGLAFTVLVLYLVQRDLPGRDDVHVGVASSLFAAFLTMGFNALYFAIVAGTTSSQASTLTLVHIPALAVSLLLMLLAIALASNDIPYMADARKLCKVMTVTIGPVIMCGFFTLCAFALAPDDSPGWYGLGIMLVVFLITLGFVCLPDRPAKTSRPFTQPARIGVGMIVVDFVLNIAVAMFTPLEPHPDNEFLIVCELDNGLLITYFAFVCADALRRTSQLQEVQPSES